MLRLNNYFYPVEISCEEASPLAGFCWLKPSNFIKTMANMNDLGHILGGHSLREARDLLLSFWSKFRVLFPQHQLWSSVDAGEKKLERCLPIFVHGDEGTSYKKGGILIVSFQGAFGYGSSKRAQDIQERYQAFGDSIPLNFLSTGFQSRMPIFVCPKECLGFDCTVCSLCLPVSFVCYLKNVSIKGSNMKHHDRG